MSVDNDEVRELSLVTAKVYITSLNSHFCSGDNATTCWYGAKRARVWIKVCHSQYSGLFRLQIITFTRSTEIMQIYNKRMLTICENRIFMIYRSDLMQKEGGEL